MHILITGGTGFIGSALCKKLLNIKSEVIAITILSRKSAAQVQQKCGSSVNVINDLDSYNNAVDVIINLAGEPIADKRWSKAQKNTIKESRYKTTQAIIQFIQRSKQKPTCLISSSAIGYYGNQGDKIVNEETSCHQEFTHEVCKEWEAIAQQAADDNVRVCLLRTGLVIGKKGGFLKRMLLPFKLGMGGRLGNGQQWMSWVHLDDLTNAMLWFINNPNLSGPFNGTAPEPVTNKEFTQTLGECLNRPTLLPVPAIILQVLLGEMSRLLLTGQRVLPTRLQESGFEFEYTALKPALLNALK